MRIVSSAALPARRRARVADAAIITTSRDRACCGLEGWRRIFVDMRVLTVSFPGGVAVDATYEGHTVHTDQPVRAGGNDSAMSPFDLFFASIATCMGFYALRFCQERGLSSKGLRLTLEPVRDENGKRVALVRVAVQLPAGFPEKYRQPMERVIDHCAVKKHIMEPPLFELTLSDARTEPAASSGALQPA